MQTLEVSEYSAVSGGGLVDKAIEFVVYWAAEKALNFTWDQTVTLATYIANNDLPYTDVTMYNAMGDFNIVPVTADNDG